MDRNFIDFDIVSLNQNFKVNFHSLFTHVKVCAIRIFKIDLLSFDLKKGIILNFIEKSIVYPS